MRKINCQTNVEKSVIFVYFCSIIWLIIKKPDMKWMNSLKLRSESLLSLNNVNELNIYGGVK